MALRGLAASHLPERSSAGFGTDVET